MDFIRKKWGIPIKDVWFNSSNEMNDFCMLKIAYNLYEPMKSFSGIVLNKWQGKTFLSDISVTPEQMQEKFKSKVRNEIRRAVKEGIITHIDNSDELKKNKLIEDFDKAYIAMYEDKGQSVKSISARLYGIAAAGKLSISTAVLPDGTVASYHSYVIGDGVARLLHSVSVFREEPEKRKMIGWANRLLHYEDMCAFGGDGIKVYDWGGMSREKNMQNITRFKEAFGGKEQETFYYVFF